LILALAVTMILALAARGEEGGNSGSNIPPNHKGLGGDRQESQIGNTSDSKAFKAPKLPKRPSDTAAIEDPEFVAARQLFWSSSYDQAEQRFLSFLEKHPDHEPTKVFLQMIHEARHFDPEKQKLVRKALEE